MVIRRGISAFRSDEQGAVLVEALVVMNVILLMLVAFIELTIAVNQWNAATKAVQIGARLASVSDPVDPVLLTLDQADPDNCNNPDDLSQPCPGNPSQSFGQRVCTLDDRCIGSNPTAGWDADAFARIHGVVNGECAAPPDSGVVRMCHFFPRIRDNLEGLEIRYTWGGLGYIDRPGGAVPVISVTLRNQPFNFMLLGIFLGQNSITMPDFTVTAVAEDFMTTYQF